MRTETSMVPGDAGRAAHLIGMDVPAILLPATDETNVDLSKGGLTIVYAYPRTSPAAGGAIDGWDAIPGARGCTPQSGAFRDHFAELKALGVERVFGISTQDIEYQREAVDRLHLPLPLLSDSRVALARALRLPLFTAGGMTLLTRPTMIIADGQIRHTFYPVLSPDRNAAAVTVWLSSRTSGSPQAH